MSNHRFEPRPLVSDIPRRLKLSTREIGVALVLTLAAAIQLMSAISSKSEQTKTASQPVSPGAQVQSAR